MTMMNDRQHLDLVDQDKKGIEQENHLISIFIFGKFSVDEFQLMSRVHQHPIPHRTATISDR